MPNQRFHVEHDPAVPDECLLVRDVRHSGFNIRLRRVFLMHLAHDTQQRLKIKRLDEIIFRALFHGFDGVADFAAARHHQHRNRRFELAHPFEQAESVQARHRQIRNQQVNALRFKDTLRGQPVFRRKQPNIFFKFEKTGNFVPNLFFIIHDEYVHEFLAKNAMNT